VRIAIRVLSSLALTLALAACGSSSKPAAQRTAPSTSTAPGSQDSVPDLPKSTRPADPAAARVVRGWTDAQRAGDIAKASSYFAVPSVVQNGTPPRQLRTRADVRTFNASLPCGARVLKVYAFERYTVVSFRLTNRPGARCDGVGHQAATAFLVRGGKIAAWLRIADRPAGPGEAPSQPLREPGASI
jgi:hypothetical protein